MSDQPQVELFGEHRYLVRVRQGEDVIEIRVFATPAVVAEFAADGADEARVVEATAAYLVARQRADDLPAQFDLDDVVAAYEGFEDDLRQHLNNGSHLSGGAGSGRSE